MNKEAGKALTIGGKKVTAEKTFTPKTKDGTVKLTFTFNGAAIKDGSKLVVFEKCYEYDTKTKTEDKLIAKHTDLNDDGQTVTLIRKDGRIEFETDRGDDDDGTIDIVPKTGDSAPLKWMLLLMLASAFGLFAAMIKRKKE